MKTLASSVAALGILLAAAGTASAASRAYCDGQARQYADQYANPAANTVGGAVAGATMGCIAGAIFGHGDCGKGAAIGAGVGAVGGGLNGGARWNQLYRRAYDECMSQPTAAPSYGGGGGYPPVGSRAWKQMCSEKYSTFNWNTGYFMGYDHQYHLCKLP